jgi:hypothetical protein
MILANSVRLSSLPKIVYEFHRFPAKNPGLLYLDHFISVSSSLCRPPLDHYVRDCKTKYDFPHQPLLNLPKQRLCILLTT